MLFQCWTDVPREQVIVYVSDSAELLMSPSLKQLQTADKSELDR